MKIMPKYPTRASGNCDAYSKRTEILSDEGERIVVLDGVEAERLPVGTICFSSRTVEMMVRKLGWELHTDEHRTELVEARRQLAQTLERLEAYRSLMEALERVFSETEQTNETKLEVVK